MTTFAPKKSAFASLLVLPLLLSAGRAMAENFPLDSIDFVSEGRQTNIIFHTGSIVPVQKVLVSSDKLMIDIDQIDATQTIRTNFTGAENISHVIIQPVNDHKVRLIIRGEGLGNPSVAFDRISAADEYVNQSAMMAPSTPASDVDSLAPLPLEKAAPAKVGKAASKATDALNTADSASSAMALGDEESTPFPSIAGPDKKSPVNLPAETSKRPVSAQPSLAADGQKASQPAGELPFADLPWLQYLPAGVLALALGGAGFLLRNKWGLLKGASPDLSVDIEESWPGTESMAERSADKGSEKTGERLGRRQSFREMADSYRRQNAEKATETDMPARKAHSEDVIGLRSLANVDDEFDLLSTPAPTRASKPARNNSPVSQPTRPSIQSKKPAAPEQLSLEDILAAMQKNQPPAAAKKKMPNPYTPPPAAQPKAKPAPVVKAGSPIAQKATAPQNNTPVNRAAAAKKAVTAPKATAPQPARARQQAEQGPAAGNPEVLNFLRNVADLMEKDGQPAIAQNIHRNLGTSPKAGLVR